jgi:prolyl-tRNA synthetase
VALTQRAPEVVEMAERLYREAWAEGIEMLLDDRDATPGVKLNDADLLGLPLRLTLGPRSLKAGGAELKQRNSEATTMVAVEQIIPTLKTEIARLFAESQQRVVPVSFPE